MREDVGERIGWFQLSDKLEVDFHAVQVQDINLGININSSVIFQGGMEDKFVVFEDFLASFTACMHERTGEHALVVRLEVVVTTVGSVVGMIVILCIDLDDAGPRESHFPDLVSELVGKHLE